jgi:DNA-binding PadR family transcriptional regulator
MEDAAARRRQLPLTESSAYILLALAEPLHGYGVMQKVREMSGGEVEIGPGTLYGAFTALRKDGLIRKMHEEGRRKTYILTDKGTRVLRAHMRRLEILIRAWSEHMSGAEHRQEPTGYRREQETEA